MGVLSLIREVLTDTGNLDECPDCGQWTNPAANRCPDCIEEKGQKP